MAATNIPAVNWALVAAVLQRDSAGSLAVADWVAQSVSGPVQVWVGVAGEAPQGAVPLMRMVIPVFKADTEAAPVRFAKPQYPVGSQHRSESAHVDLRYLVREDGKPDPASIEILSVVVQTNRPVGPVAEGFGASAVKAIADSRFHPAMVRGCPVRSTVVQRISFRIG